MTWTPQDAQTLRSIKAALIEQLESEIPESAGNTMEERAIHGIESDMARKLIKRINHLATTAPAKGDQAGFIRDDLRGKPEDGK